MHEQSTVAKLRDRTFWIIGLLMIGVAIGVTLMTQPPETKPFDLLPPILRGLKVTMQLTAGGTLLALIVALIAGIARTSKYTIVRFITGVYVEIFRGSSVLVQMFWIFFVLPLPPFNVELTALQAGILALGLNVGAYGAEVVRGAIQAIDRGQVEASVALNMSPGLMMRRVIIPQATVRMLPPFGNLMIELLKATSLASLITLSDLTFQASTLRQTVGRIPEVFGVLLIVYFLLAYPLTLGVRWLERQRQWA